jgi:hypothetical protein
MIPSCGGLLSGNHFVVMLDKFVREEADGEYRTWRRSKVPSTVPICSSSRTTTHSSAPLRSRALSTFANDLAVLFQPDAMELLGDVLMRRRLRSRDGVAADAVAGTDDRLAGQKTGAEIDRPGVSDRGVVLCQPALHDVALVILLSCPVVRREKLRRQWQGMLVISRFQIGTKRRVELSRAAVRTAQRGALVAFDLVRGEMFGSVQRNQHSPTQALKRRERPSCFTCPIEKSAERQLWDTAQHQPDRGGARGRRHAKERLAVRLARSFRQRPPMYQERRTSREECRPAELTHRVVSVATRYLALGRKTGPDLAQLRCQPIKGAHPIVGSAIESRRPIDPPCYGEQHRNP